MSMDMIRQNYLRGLWTRAMVFMAADAGLITREEAEEIVGEN